ncbi:condensation protein [Marinomonas rhizomae]|uniref:Phosphopantetheine binding protein n=1 Tax=Marinomonas rhizomae TaxID=491948 RepID=A0A366JFR6_9GAMM|nr:condensation domain-containing protein [Marinomonas rhizomae]RBP85793.1 phosphopantetheine binding protein [Marinomonas rhizomae]RNF75852.1 condensation protein [Marinomonas rhizomae]
MFTQVSNFSDTGMFQVSDYEENIWMLQLQQPEQVPRNIHAWKLNSHADLVLLRQAILDVIKENPNLNARYSFSDDGEVVKYHSQDYGACLTDVTLQGDVFSYLEARQGLAWDAANTPPFSAVVVHAQPEDILVVDIHPMLDQSYKFEELIACIQHNYQQLSLSGPALLLTPLDSCSIQRRNNAKQIIEPSKSQLTKGQVANIILNEFRVALVEPDMTLEDDFFDHGGHSLLATRVIGKLLQSHGIEVNFNDFFKSSTALTLAERAITNGQAYQQDASESPSKECTAPLTLAQNFLWQAYSAYDFSPIYNLPFVISFEDRVDEAVLSRAFNDVLVRHASLRTMFNSQNGQVTQHIIPTSELDQYKWFWRSDESKGITPSDEASYQFDLTCELPLRVRCIHDSVSEPQILSLLVHHMVIDEWSLNTMMADLSYAYMARANTHEPIWEQPARTINDFALLQSKQGLNRQHVDYWVHRLHGATKGLSFSESNYQADVTGDMSTKAQWTELDLGKDAFQKLSTFARQHESSLFSVLYTAIALSLHIEGKLEEVVIGTSASGRTDPDFFDTVGYFTTMVAHRVQFDHHELINGLLASITEQINESMSYADIPINLIQQELGMPIDDGLLFDVYIHIHSNNALNGSLQSPTGDIFYQQVPPEKKDSMFGLHFEVMDDVLAGGLHALRIVTTFQEARFSKVQVDSILKKVSEILTMFCSATDCSKPIDQIQL